jgi:hypothetical protein
MDVNRDFSELLSALNDAGAQYLVVGAHAVAYYTEPRYTKDFDLWVAASARNAERVWAALAQFGAPLKGMQRADFANPDLVYQMGVEPNRVDVLMGIDGVTFATAWRNRVRTSYGGIPIFVLGYADLLRAKRAAGRPQDLLDLERLTAARHSRARKSQRRK